MTTTGRPFSTWVGARSRSRTTDVAATPTRSSSSFDVSDEIGSGPDTWTLRLPQFQNPDDPFHLIEPEHRRDCRHAPAAQRADSPKRINQSTSLGGSCHVLLFRPGRGGRGHEHLRPRVEGRPTVHRLQHEVQGQRRIRDDSPDPHAQGLGRRRGGVHQSGEVSNILRRPGEWLSSPRPSVAAPRANHPHRNGPARHRGR